MRSVSVIPLVGVLVAVSFLSLGGSPVAPVTADPGDPPQLPKPGAEGSERYPDSCNPTTFSTTLRIDPADNGSVARPEARHEWDACTFVARAYPSPRIDAETIGQEGSCTFTINTEHKQNYTESEAYAEGNCDGIRLQLEVHTRATPAALKYWPKNALGDFDPTLNSEVAGHDSGHIEMWDNHLHFFYLFNGSNRVYAYSASNHTTDNVFWYLIYTARSHWCAITNSNGTCWKASGYSSAGFHSNGFPFSWMPDVDAWSTARGHAYGSGYKYCSYWYDWAGAGNYPNLHVHFKCYLT